MNKSISCALLVLVLFGSILVSACSKKVPEPKNDLADLAYMITNYLSQGDNFKFYLYDFPEQDTSAYILKTISSEVIVEDYQLKIKNPARNFDLHRYNSMSVKYFTRNPTDPARVERMEIYLDAK